jgi:sugar lactone lactonase YvrE
VVAEGLSYPTDVAFDNQGQLYAVASLDPKTNAIFQIDPENGSHTVVAEHPTGLRALAFDDENRMFVSDIVNATVYEVMADGTLHALRPGGFSAVGGLAVLPREDGGESLFATDLWGGLREFDTETGEQVSHVPNSPYPGSPVPALVLGKIDGRLVLGSSKSGEVQIWDPQAQHEVARAFIGYSGDIVAYEGDLVIPSAFGVFRVDPANPSEQETISHFVAPTVGVAVIGNDLYVAGVSDGRLMQIAEEGEMLQERRLVVQDLERAEGMALAPDGRLLVVESAAGRLSAVDVMTGEVETIVEGLEFVQPQETIEYEYPFYLMNDVAVDSNGNIYISGDGANVIYKITLPGNSRP